MTSPLSGSLAKAIGGAFKGLFLDAVLTRYVVPDSPAPDPIDPPEPVPVEYPCKAIHDTYSDFYRAQGLVEAGDRKVLILATSLTVTPQENDKITIRGETFSVVMVRTDPALAVWECQARA